MAAADSALPGYSPAVSRTIWADALGVVPQPALLM